jgi:hypothetical protein
MEQEQLEKFRSWFADFTAGFYGDDEYVNANIKLKEGHSLRTCDEVRYLAEELGLDAGQRRIAEVIALLHDVGRFPQFIKYRTYNDPRSINHCLLSLEVLREKNVLEGTAERERRLIEQAIEYHGLKELPGGLDEECLLFSRLIRDADKLDILYVVTGYYAQYRDEPESFKLEIELPNEPGYSAAIVEAVLNEQRIDYDDLETWNDMKLLQLSWVYDVNFAATLKRMRQKRLLENVLDFLPDTQDIERVAKKISEYVDSRIEQNG